MRAFLALVALDLKLSGRALFAPLADKAVPARLAVVVAALLGVHAAAWPVGLWIGAHEGGDSLAVALRTAALFVLPWTVSSPLSTLARGFATRGDLDLLLASPASIRSICAARLLALGLESVGAAGLLMGPLANVCALQGRPHWLALYPALLGAGLAGAALGAALALAGGPGRCAASGEPRALAFWMAGALAIYALGALALARPFLHVAQRASGAAATGRAGPTPKVTASLAGALRAKEARLLWRDPWLLSQMGLQALYTLPGRDRLDAALDRTYESKGAPDADAKALIDTIYTTGEQALAMP